MKLRLLALTLLTSIGLHQPAWAVLLAYEGFDYDTPEDTALEGKEGGFGWTGPWELANAGPEGEFAVLPESLSSPAYPVSTTGGSAQVAGPGTGGSNTVRIRRPLATPFDLGQDGVLYASFLFQKNVSNPPSANNMEFDLITAGGSRVIRFGSTSSDQWFLHVSSDPFGSVVLDETYFIVLKVEANALSDNLRSVMTFDSSQTVLASEPVAWDFSNSFDSSDELAGVEFWIGRLAEGIFDEIRIGTTWESVTVSEVMFPVALPGDFNEDGTVDAADYTVWRDGLGDLFDEEDYELWKQNFGSAADGGALAAAAAVPEPGAWPMLLLGVLFIFAWLERRLRLSATPQPSCCRLVQGRLGRFDWSHTT